MFVFCLTFITLESLTLTFFVLLIEYVSHNICCHFEIILVYGISLEVGIVDKMKYIIQDTATANVSVNQ